MNPATDTTADVETTPKENFADLLNETFGEDGFEGKVLKGTVLAVDSDVVTIDVGLKSEGRVPLKEFGAPGRDQDISIGDTVDVFVERFEDRDGVIRLSREKARREEAWTDLEKSFKATERVNGVIFGRVKGGFIVDLSGAVAFLPGSQVDIRPVRDVAPLMGSPQPFQILKMDAQRNNIVVSRRAVLEETRTEARSELMSNLSEGQVLEGVVKNITDYGAFIDLGGVDGLLHVTDIAWKRINHPSEALQIGETIKVQVIRFNAETQRISLGVKQLEADPWDGVAAKYPIGSKYSGRVTNITDYGAFVELEAGVEGLVHVSEMSWTKKNVHPGKIVSTSQEVEVVVLDTDSDKRRISLGLKQCMDNPWESFVTRFPIESIVEGEIKNITEFGLFIGLDGEIDGMAHLSDLSWEKTGEDALVDFTKGQMVKAKVLDVDVEKERISLGVKQLSEDRVGGALDGLSKGLVVTCTVYEIVDNGIEVRVNDSVPGFIRKSELSRDRSEQRPDRFAPGEKVDAKITQLDKVARRVTLSIKAREVREEKEAMATYGSTDAGASLGDILGAAIAEKQQATEGENGQEPIREEAVKKRVTKKDDVSAVTSAVTSEGKEEHKVSGEETGDPEVTPEE
ncbi:MAG: 30S ribosomal protein S1 [Rhodospirillaceae bacterium TMED8]|nr:30S ribosomal protein S1 [Magnetovibrio sp.]OUT49920.1 MAG: 30S ribosomal protein S1 [Rhodospirillaceae bacterium TMED8]|tara:strand:- start:4372 stop:6252 length:1881 start_codon:yes stop_codon:yes gene_type:complete